MNLCVSFLPSVLLLFNFMLLVHSEVITWHSVSSLSAYWILSTGASMPLCYKRSCVFGSNEEGIQDVVILSERTEHLPLIEIRIKECQGASLTTASNQ